MNKLYSFITCAALLAFMLTQTSCKMGKGSIVSARDHYKKMEYALSNKDYQSVYSKTKNKEEKKEASFKAAECYRFMNDIKNAESWYRKAIKTDSKNVEAQLRLAQCLKTNAKFTDAITEFNNFKKFHSDLMDEATVDREIKGCEYALKWKNEKTRYVVENVKGLNTKWEDFAAAYSRKDQLIFTSDREKGVSGNQYGWTGNGHTDLYVTNLKINKKNPNDISYSMPTLLDKGVVNSKYNDGTACFDSKYTTMYFTQCNGADGKGNYCRIYKSTLAGTEWSKPEALPFSADSFSCGHPTLSKDGSIMYFSSNMPGSTPKPVSADNPDGTKLSKDIWMVTYTKRGNTWGDPVNLGPAINTSGDELFPFIHEDGTLYFASNGHVGLGGTDIYYTKGQATDWSDPVNMKSPINSAGDDFAIILSKDKESGFFSSNREGSKGQDDIWRFYMNPLIFNLSGVVRNAKTHEIIPNAVVTITSSNDTGKIILKTDATGSYKLKLKNKTDYELFAAKEDHYDSRMAFQTTKGLEQSTDLVQNFDLVPFNFDSIIVLQGIYYDLDKADLRPESRAILDTLVMTLAKYPRVRIELGSHTDCRADSLYNIGLSQRRADSAVAYLISKGIDSLRIVSKGYGETRLVNKCKCEGAVVVPCTEEEHQLNRRTTVQFLDNNYSPPKPKAPEVKPTQLPRGRPAGGQRNNAAPPNR